MCLEASPAMSHGSYNLRRTQPVRQAQQVPCFQMKEADKALTGMEKWCGLCVCPWNRLVEAAGGGRGGVTGQDQGGGRPRHRAVGEQAGDGGRGGQGTARGTGQL